MSRFLIQHGRSLARLTAVTGVLLLSVPGCSRPSEEQTDMVQVTPTAERAVRRAYDGAPPVIPHKSLKADCSSCHTTTGKRVSAMGFAPANPHSQTSVVGETQNCRQCHLFRQTDEQFAKSLFVGIPQTITKGSRAYPGAPPMIPHSELMRENCLACHAGPSARKEIVCSHTSRTNCQQCHLFTMTTSEFRGL